MECSYGITIIVSTVLLTIIRNYERRRILRFPYLPIVFIDIWLVDLEHFKS